MNVLKAAALALAIGAATPVVAEPSPDIQRAQALIDAGKTQEAAAALEQTIARNQSDVEALTMLSALYIYHDMFDEALAQAQAAMAVAPGDPRALQARGRALLYKGDLPKAIADFDAALAQEPDADILADRASAKAEMGDLAGSVADLEAAGPLDPSLLRIPVSLAGRYALMKRYDEALKQTEIALALDPTFKVMLFLRAQLLLILKGEDEAIGAYEHLVQLYPKDVEAQVQLGDAYAAQWRLPEALKSFSRATRIDAQSSAAWTGKGRILARQGEHKAALRDFDRAILIEPTNADLLADRGESRAALGDARAGSDFDAALKISPDSTYALIARARYRQVGGDLEGALEDYDAALKITPDDVYALANRADVFLSQNRFDRAMKDLNAVLKLEPHPDIYLLKGKAYAKMDDHLQAIENFDEAIRLQSDNAVAWRERSKSKAALGDEAGSAADRAQALKLDPKIETAS
jgi:tetratricopeptide (TPR) repeat protein